MAKYSRLGAFMVVLTAFTVGFALTQPWQAPGAADFCSQSTRFEARGNCAKAYATGADAINPRIYIKAAKTTRDIHSIQNLKVFEWNILNLFERKIPGYTDASKNVSNKAPQAKPKFQTDGIARLINKEDPDVLVLIEVENIQALTQYAEQYHPGKYHALLIEGNDSRGIDIAFLVKKDLPFDMELRSHRSTYDTQRDETIFSRDLPVLILRESGKPKPLLLVAGTHYKSMRGDGADPLSTNKRLDQAEATKVLLDELQAEFKDTPTMVAGDFNNAATAPEFKPFADIGYRDAVAVVPDNKGPDYSHYYFSKEGADFGKLDSVMVSPSVIKNNLIKSADILEHIDENGRTIPPPRNYDERESKHPSDHLPTAVILDFQRLRGLSGN